MSAFSVDTSRQTTPPLVDGVVHKFTTDWSSSHHTRDQMLAQLVDVLDYAVVHTLHALFTFFPVLAVRKLLKSFKI